MGTLDDIKAVLGEDFFDRKTERRPIHVWNELCVCGHLDRFHAPAIGGSYRIPQPQTGTDRPQSVTRTMVFGGCLGAVRPRGFEELTQTANDDVTVITFRINPTCPCEEFRPVAKVDRPNRYFCQRIPADRDSDRHPFVIGLRAFSTHLGKRKAAETDPGWPAAEFDRRFQWIEGARVCGQPKCKATDGVLPVFLGATGDRSELRCPKHRPTSSSGVAS